MMMPEVLVFLYCFRESRETRRSCSFGASRNHCKNQGLLTLRFSRSGNLIKSRRLLGSFLCIFIIIIFLEQEESRKVCENQRFGATGEAGGIAIHPKVLVSIALLKFPCEAPF